MPLLTSVVLPSVTAAIGWGVSPICNKICMDLNNNDYMIVFFLHILLCGIITLLIALFYQEKFKKLIANKKLSKILTISIIGAIFVVLGYYFFYRAMANSANTTLVVLIVYVLPILVVSVLSRLILKEKLTCGMIIGLLISIIGIAIFTYYNK